MDTGAVYAAERAVISATAMELDDPQLATQVPGCPAWTVQDLLAHLVGLCTDLSNGMFEGAGTEPWTALQVADRKGRTVPELLAEWEQHAPGLEAQLTDWGFLGMRVGYDITMHDDDMREALGRPLGETAVHQEVLDGLAAVASRRLAKAGGPALRIQAGDRTWTLGEGDPDVTLRAPDTGELGRALGGRRALSVVRTWDWDGDPEPFLPHLPFFPPPD
ncbi:MAG TPA: maleylpyruvate isomerase family mycothiol-dependent enzyme [Mycobacteriales bacterium]|nr:maleylpyruvate isomerase family mycothiol-dependent enzyme [Mycobacteriales bacterium]